MSLDRALVVDALPGYEVGAELGRGGWGIVFAGQHRTLDRPVAIKVLPRAFGADPVVRARFLDEARVVARLRHPHIVPLYDFVEYEGAALMVMELLTGGTLTERAGEGIRQDSSCAVALAVASALQHAHEHDQIHRDVKPENVLFSDDGVPKLADFGLTRSALTGSSGLTVSGEVLGTPAYLAPEQARGLDVSTATDVYSLGVVLYELLAGVLPFPDATDTVSFLHHHAAVAPVPLERSAPGVGAPIAAVVMRALEKEPVDRYPSAEAFGVALAEAADDRFGVGWVARSGIALLANDRITRAADRSAETEGFAHAAPPASSGALTLPPGSGVSPVPPTPSLPPPPAPAQAPRGAPAPARRRVWRVALVSLVVLAGIGVLVAVLVGGDEGDQRLASTVTSSTPSTIAPTTTVAAPPATAAPVVDVDGVVVPAATLEAIDAGCERRALEDDVCACLALGASSQLTVAEIQVFALGLLETDNTAFDEVIDQCRERVGSG